MMTTKEMISALRLKGYKVKARQRTDGGWLITEINGTKYSAAKGNERARNLLGITQSAKRVAQQKYNVSQYIQAKKKIRTLDKETKKILRSVQRTWRKNQVKGRITAANVKRHIKEFGWDEALAYLRRQKRYGQGYAYEKNVEYLAQYIDDIAESIADEEAKQQAKTCASIIRAYTGSFKEKWINMIYNIWYGVRESGFTPESAKEAIRTTYDVMKS